MSRCWRLVGMEVLRWRLIDASAPAAPMPAATLPNKTFQPLESASVIMMTPLNPKTIMNTKCRRDSQGRSGRSASLLCNWITRGYVKPNAR
jgi:hypothetical protein